MWETNDHQGFHYMTKVERQGQINPNDSLGHFLVKIAQDTSYRHYLEIGTWNGLGSTRCIQEGFRCRTHQNAKLISLECNKEKCEEAQKFYQNDPFIHILNKTLLPSTFSFEDIKAIFPSANLQWLHIDLSNMAECGTFVEEDPSIVYDVVLLDGGEYTTYFEYQLLKSRCHILILDDTQTDKCSLIRQELLTSSQWLVLEDHPYDRNGWSVFQHI
jgi:hypothetical protein